MAKRPVPAVLIVRDGWGRNPHPEHDKFNAIKQARTPHADMLLQKYPWTLIRTSGEDVGLPDGTMGNSEVGHQNMGAGRIVNQDSVRITKAIRDGDFFENKALLDAITAARDAGKNVHLMGIASDAGVHGLLEHLYACLELCKREGVEDVYIHLFTDGRDTEPFSGKDYVMQVYDKCQELGIGEIVSVIGRYYAMDRDNRWTRVARAYSCLTGIYSRDNDVAYVPTPDEALRHYYAEPTSPTQKGDEFVEPTMVGHDVEDDPIKTRLRDGDSVIFYNYRGDRPREIIKALMLDDEAWQKVPASPDTGQHGFDRGHRPKLRMVTMTAYEEGLPVEVAFPKPPKMANIAGQWLSEKGLRQFRCAETEKFPHVTFFFNDYREQPFEGESRQMAQSPKVPTYDMQPEMSAAEVGQHVLSRIEADDCEDFILVNFANCDMVGHTGSLDAAIKAVETVDEQVGKIVEAVLARGGVLVVTADHGNAEQMYLPEADSAHTAHTTYEVDCIVVGAEYEKLASGSADRGSHGLRKGGRLSDVMPTIFEMMGLDVPPEMTGQSLLVGGG